MADYIYKTAVYKNVGQVIDPPANWNAQKTDYETSHRASTIKVNDVQIAATSFEIEKSFTDFDALISTPYDWGDVKEVDLPNRYQLYLITSEPL